MWRSVGCEKTNMRPAKSTGAEAGFLFLDWYRSGSLPV